MDPRLLTLARSAPGAGDLDAPDAGLGTAEHPVCGDRVQVQVTCSTGTITALAWRASGCPATLAVAAAAHAALVGAKGSDAPQLLRAKLASLGDLATHERHAERIFGEALVRALLATVPGKPGSA